jgi:hypothetical protein
LDNLLVSCPWIVHDVLRNSTNLAYDYREYVMVFKEDGDLLLHTDTRTMTLKWDDLDDYYGERALRGSLLPKGWRKVTRLASG